MSPVSKRRGATAALTVLGALAGCTGDPDVAGDGLAEIRSSLGTGDPGAIEEALITAAGEIEPIAASDPGFSNFAIDNVQNRITVYRSGPLGQASLVGYTAVADAAGAALDFQSARVTQAQAQALEARLVADLGDKAPGAFDVTQFAPDGHGGAFRIGVEGDLMAARAVLSSGYAAAVGGALEIAAAAPCDAYSRADDRAPYYGGGNVINSHGAGCTAGLTALSTNGNHYMLTAYHCIDPASPGLWDGGGRTSANFIGNASAYDPGLDTAYIPTLTLPWIWDGAAGQPEFNKRVVGALKPVTGLYVWNEGAYTRAKKGVVDYYMHCRRRHPYTQVVHDIVLWQAYAYDGGVLGGQGDSGGPIIAGAPNNSVRGVGIVHGTDGHHWISCPGRACSIDLLFPDLSHIATIRNLDFSR